MDFSRFLPWDQSELEVSNNILIKCLKLYSEVLSGKLIRYYDYYKGKGITEEALSFTNTYDTVNHVISDARIREGKRYWEHKVLEEGEIVRIGVVKSSYPEPSSSWFYCSNGTVVTSVGTFNAPTYTTNDTIGIALDVKSGILSFYKNGEHIGIYLNNLYGTDLFSCVELGSLSSVKINFQEIKYSLSNYENGLYDYVTNVEAGLEELQYFWDIYKTKVSQKYRNILDPDGLVKKIQDINNISSSTISGNPSEQAYFLNLPELLKSKGTLKSLKGIFKFFGIDIEVIPWYSPDYTKHIKTGVIIRIVLGGEYVSSAEIYLLIEQLVYLILDVCAVITNINVYKRLYTDAPDLEDSLEYFLTTLSKCIPYRWPQNREDLYYEPYFVAPFKGYLTGRDICKADKNLPDYSGKYGNACPALDDCLNQQDRVLYTFLKSTNFKVGRNADIIDYQINDGRTGQTVTPNYTNDIVSSWYVTLPGKEKIEVVPVYSNNILDYTIYSIGIDTIFVLPLELNKWKIVSSSGNIVVSIIDNEMTLVSSDVGSVLITPVLDTKNNSLLSWKITNSYIGIIYLSPILSNRIIGLTSVVPITPVSSTIWNIDTPSGQVEVRKENDLLVSDEKIVPVYVNDIIDHWNLIAENVIYPIYTEKTTNIVDWTPNSESQENIFIISSYSEGIEPDWKIINVSPIPLQQTSIPIYGEPYSLKVGDKRPSLPYGNPETYPSFPTEDYVQKFTVPIVIGSNNFNYSYNSSLGKGASGISGYTSFGDFYEYCIVKTTTIGRHNNEQIEYSENYEVLHTDEKSDLYSYPYYDELLEVDMGSVIDTTLEEATEYTILYFLKDNYETINLDFEDSPNLDFNDANVSLDFNITRVHDLIEYYTIEVIEEIVWKEEIASDIPTELVCISDFYNKQYLRSLKVIYKNIIGFHLVVGEFIVGGTKTLAQTLGIYEQPEIGNIFINWFFINVGLNLDSIQTKTIPIVGSIIAGDFEVGPYYEYDSNIDCATTIIPSITDYWGNIDSSTLYRIGYPLIGNFIINAEPRYVKDRVFRLIITDPSGDEINSYDFEINGMDMDFELNNMNLDFGVQ